MTIEDEIPCKNCLTLSTCRGYTKNNLAFYLFINRIRKINCQPAINYMNISFINNGKVPSLTNSIPAHIHNIRNYLISDSTDLL